MQLKRIAPIGKMDGLGVEEWKHRADILLRELGMQRASSYIEMTEARKRYESILRMRDDVAREIAKLTAEAGRMRQPEPREAHAVPDGRIQYRDSTRPVNQMPGGRRFGVCLHLHQVPHIPAMRR